MDLNLTEDQESIREVFAAFFDGETGPARARSAEPLGFDAAAWERLLETGAPGMGVAQFREMDPAAWAQFVDLNLYGVLHCTKAVVEGMCERGWGRVVNVSSGAGQTGLRLGIALYGAGKGAALSFMRHFAMEVAGTGVTANTVALGLIDNHLDPTVTEGLRGQVPVGRLGQRQDIAPSVLFLASDEAGWITGQILGVNGGSLMI